MVVTKWFASVVEEMPITEAEIQGMGETVQAMRAELTALRERQQEMANSNFQRALNSVPTYDGKHQPFREHLTNFLAWKSARNIIEHREAKTALCYSLKNSAQTRIRAFLPGTAAFDNASTFETYLGQISEIFEPSSERGLSRSEFLAYTQSPNEDVGNYLAVKFSLWEIAYGTEERSYQTLRSNVIKGLWNTVIKRTVSRMVLKDQEELRQGIFQAVAAERECFLNGYAESTSLDGLRAVTITNASNRSDGAEPMEVDALWDGNKKKDRVQPGRGQQPARKETRSCHRCQRPGHIQKDCRAKTDHKGRKLGDQKGSGSKKGCFACGRDGHKAVDCPKKRQRVNQVEEADDWEDCLLTDGDLHEISMEEPHFLGGIPPHRQL